MKMKPDNAPLIDLSQHRRPEEGREETVLENVLGALALGVIALVIIFEAFAL
jgi:hypothetical protein